jgi:hypothetical protein
LKGIRDLTPPLDQLTDILSRFVTHGVEERPLVRNEGAQPVDHQAFQIARRNAPAIGTAPRVPAKRNVET